MCLFHTVTLVLVLAQLGSLTVPSQGTCVGGIETYMQRLPGTVLANYLCKHTASGCSTTLDLGPRFKRQTSQLSQVQAKFGAANIAKLTQTLSTFFNEDIANYVDLLMNHDKFYWAERSVLKKALTNHKSTDSLAGIEAIKHLRGITDLQVQLQNMRATDSCGLYAMLGSLGQSANCALWNLRSVAMGDPCEGVVYDGPR